MRGPRPRRSALPLVALAIALALGAAVAAPTPAFAAADSSARVMRVVHGYSGEQLTNAAIIVAVGERMGLGRWGAVLGVMTAMGESSLRNIDYGDGAINPDGTVADSIGLFQQQHWWGSRAERMTPAIAAARFFQRLRMVPNWRDLAPTAAAHAVQRNADPYFYARFLSAAEAVVTAVEPAAARVAARHASSANDPSPAKNNAGSADSGDPWNIEDLPGMPDLSGVDDLSPLPDFTDLAGAGFGDAVLDELRHSGVALPNQQAQPTD